LLKNCGKGKNNNLDAAHMAQGYFRISMLAKAKLLASKFKIFCKYETKKTEKYFFLFSTESGEFPFRFFPFPAVGKIFFRFRFPAKGPENEKNSCLFSFRKKH